MKTYHLAQINIGRIKGVDINDPIMKEFVDNLDRINEIAENHEGFIWRLKDDSNNATSLNPYNDEQIIINVSVWKTLEDLERFVYRTVHTDFLRRRREWFHSFGKAFSAMWWIPAGHLPTVQEATEKLEYLEINGPSQLVFDYKHTFPSP